MSEKECKREERSIRRNGSEREGGRGCEGVEGIGE